VPAIKRVLEEFLWDPNAIYWSIGHCFGARELLPVYGKPEVVMAAL